MPEPARLAEKLYHQLRRPGLPLLKEYRCHYFHLPSERSNIQVVLYSSAVLTSDTSVLVLISDMEQIVQPLQILLPRLILNALLLPYLLILLLAQFF